MQDLEFMIKMLLRQVDDLNNIMKEWVLFKILNLLKSSFETYLTVLNEKAKTEKTFPDLDTFLKRLKNIKILFFSKNLLNTVLTNLKMHCHKISVEIKDIESIYQKINREVLRKIKINLRLRIDFSLTIKHNIRWVIYFMIVWSRRGKINILLTSQVKSSFGQ